MTKHYPLDVRNLSDEYSYILMSKGHHDPHEFMRAASEWAFGDCLSTPKHKWVKAVPCRCGEHSCHYELSDEPRKGWFPATYAWEAYGDDRYHVQPEVKPGKQQESGE